MRAAILFPGRAVNQQCGRVDVDGAIRQRDLRELQVRQRRPEQVARCRPVDHLIKSAARQPERRGGDT